MAYISLVGAVSSVIAAIYAIMAYYRMRAEDNPTLHVRCLEPMEEDEYHLVLEVHPGKQPARYRALSICGGYIGPKQNESLENVLEHIDANDFRRCHKANIFVPPAVARDVGPELSVTLRMKRSAVLSLCPRRKGLSRKLSIRINSGMVDDS